MRSSLNLYDLNKLLRDSFDGAIDETTGEIQDERLVELLEEISEIKEERILFLAKKLDEYEAEAEAVGKKIKSQQARKNSLTKKAESLAKYIRSNMKPTDVFKDDEAEVCFQKGKPSVFISREKDKLRLKRLRLVYPEYVTESLVHTPDKTELKKAMDTGKKFIGIRIEQEPRLVIK